MASSKKPADKDEHISTDGLFNVNSFLDDGTPGFTHSNRVKPDRGSFSLDKLRRRDAQRADRGGSRVIALPRDRYLKVPLLAKGLSACHLNHLARDRNGTRAMDLELAIATHPKNTTAMRSIIQARNSSNSTQLIYNATMTWMEAKQGAKDCWITTTKFDLASGEKKKRVDFPRPFEKDVEVLGWIKDFRFLTYDGSPYTLDVWASEVDKSGFTANASGSRAAERVVATWIVHYKGKRKVASGLFGTDQMEQRKHEQAFNAGRVQFEKGAFSRPPTVLVGLNQIDHAGGRDLRIEAKVTSVDQDGFHWQLNTWGDNSQDALRSAEATYIALGFV